MTTPSPGTLEALIETQQPTVRGWRSTVAEQLRRRGPFPKAMVSSAGYLLASPLNGEALRGTTHPCHESTEPFWERPCWLVELAVFELTEGDGARSA